MVLPRDLAEKGLTEPATVRVTIQDVTMADESSTTVAETVVPSDGSGLAGPFELEADLTPGRQYAVYVHVDRAGDGAVAVGDLINTQRIPVPADAGGGAVHVDVPVQVVD